MQDPFALDAVRMHGVQGVGGLWPQEGWLVAGGGGGACCMGGLRKGLELFGSEVAVGGFMGFFVVILVVLLGRVKCRSG